MRSFHLPEGELRRLYYYYYYFLFPEEAGVYRRHSLEALKAAAELRGEGSQAIIPHPCAAPLWFAQTIGGPPGERDGCGCGTAICQLRTRAHRALAAAAVAVAAAAV